MRLGLIAYADNTGLGSQTKQYFDHLEPAKTMVLDRSSGVTPYPCYPERYPGAMVVKGLPDFDEVAAFLKDLDVVLMAETAPTEHLMRSARERNVKTVIVPNWEYFHHFQNPKLLLPDLLLAPSLWHFDEYPEPKAYLPFPIELKFRDTSETTAKNFLHIGGKPISPDRNGTFALLEALEYVTADINMTITCTDPRVFEHRPPLKNPHVTLTTHLGVIDDLEPFYNAHDVLVMPRRFGGLCLPVNEALGHGLPVIMPDISPNNTWLPKHWLVPAEKTAERQMASTIDIYTPDPRALAQMIDQFATRPMMYHVSCDTARQIATDHSWETLLPLYMEVLTSVLS